ncbi:GlcNAc-transferase family protein [Pantoea sp. NPDC088449]|uniref:GlcNAc-transferase family protein n=1 Tax=Pantoea sp. NPDC088449 TaxID=3364392 RepID=UPI00382F4AD7
MNNNKTIFIGIASYRDAELVPTLLDILARAQHAERLHIAICWQDNGKLHPFIDSGFIPQLVGEHHGHTLYRLIKGNAQIQLLAVDYLKSQGACWARHMSNTLYNGESYHLQIDSHSRFTAHWDSEMIAMLESLRSQSPRPILTHYPPPYTPEQKKEQRSNKVSRLIFSQFNDKGVVSLNSVDMVEEQPRRSGYLAAGYLFSDGHFIENVPYDPQLFFIGEEISLAARAFTHGYDLYTPHKVLLWHYYGRAKSPKFWSDHTNEAKKSGQVDQVWWERDNISYQRIQSLLGISDKQVDLGHWCLGTHRTLQEYQYRIGVDFRQQRIHPLIKAKEKLTWFDHLPEEHELWQQQLVSPHLRMWQLTHADVDILRKDVLWWQLSVYQADNTPLINQQLSPEELLKLKSNDNGEKFDLRVYFDTQRPVAPHCVRLCPYIDGEGWGDIKERAW